MLSQNIDNQNGVNSDPHSWVGHKVKAKNGTAVSVNGTYATKGGKVKRVWEERGRFFLKLKDETADADLPGCFSATRFEPA